MRYLLLALGLSLAAPQAGAEGPSKASFKRNKQQEREELIAKLKRDIAKVAHSVEVTKELVARSKGAPFLPDIYLRLAELYVEQARYEFYLVHEQRGEDSKGSAVAPTAKLLKEKAVETYLRILQDFPDFKDNDKVMFFLGHEYRELGRYEDMIAQYEKLVGRYPKSPLVQDAYLVLGDYRFDKQDLAGAKGYYQKILDTPKSPTHDMAHFKMGWVYLNETNYKEAMQQFEAAVRPDWSKIEGNKKEKERRVDVKREALVDLVYAYTEVRKPKGALRYFRGLARSRTMYLLALRKLANRYFVKANYNAAAMVYREIAKLSSDAERNLDNTGRIYQSAKNMKDYRRVNRDVTEMLRALNDYRFDWRVPKAQRVAATRDFEEYTRDLSTRAQAYAKRRRRRRIGERAALAYTRYLESFPDNKNGPNILQNLADTLYDAKYYLKAGDRYVEAYHVVESPKLREQNLYNACAAFREALKNADKLPRFERIWAQQGLIKNGSLYVQRYPKSSKVPQIKLNIGRSYYEAGDYDHAEGVFDEYIKSYPRDRNAVVAADLILDGYAQRQDFQGLAKKARELMKNRRLGDPAFRARLAKMAKGAEERQIGEVLLTASANEQAGGDAGEQLRKYWEANKGSPVAEKTLYTAFVQYKDARDFKKTFETGNQFIGAYPKSQYLGDVFGTLAAFTTQTGEFEQASVYLEEYFKRFPRDPAAQRTLAKAAQLKQLIGDHRSAIQDYNHVIRAASSSAERAEYGDAALDSYEAIGDWKGAAALARRILRWQPGNVKANLMLGLAKEKEGNLDSALRSFSRAIDAAQSGTDDKTQEQGARAAFLAGDTIYRQFARLSGGDLETVAAQKAQLLGELENAMVNAVGYNQGTWAVAALHRVALAYQEFASFLKNAPPPDGLAPEQVTEYKQLIGEQAKAIDQKAREYFSTCVKKARELKVFNGAVLGCVARGPEKNVPSVRLAVASPGKERRDSLKQQLTNKPKDLKTIGEMVNYFLQSGEPAKAKLMAERGLEIDDRDASLWNKLGMAELLLSKPQAAFFDFKRARENGHPYAAANELALRMSFGDTRGARRLLKNVDADDLPSGAPDLHPDAAKAINRLEGRR